MEFREKLNLKGNRLRNYFSVNSYLSFLFDKIVKRFLINKFSPTLTKPNVDEQMKYITLPFQGNYSYHVKIKLQTLLKIHFPQISFRSIITNSFTISSILKYKDRIPDIILLKCCVWLFHSSLPRQVNWFHHWKSNNHNI